MVNESITSDLSVPILLKIDVYAETLFECEDKLLKLLLSLLTQRFTIFINYFLYVRIGFWTSRLFLLGL